MPPLRGTTVRVLFSAVFVLVLLLGSVSYLSIQGLLEHQRSVEHTERVIAETNELLVAFVDAQNGQRGYVITGDARFLEPFHRAVENRPHQIRLLRELTRDDPLQQARFARLRDLADQRLAYLNATIEHRRRGDFEGAVAQVASGAGETQTTGLREIIAEIMQDEERLLAVRRRRAEAHATYLQILLAITTILGGAVVAGAGVWIGREMRRRAAAERQAADAHAMLDRIIDVAPLPVIAEDDFHRVTLWNPAAEHVFGWKEAEVLGRPNPLLRDREFAETAAVWERAAANETITAAEVIHRTRRGERLEMEASAAPIRGPGQETRGWMVVLQDIAERKRAGQELQRSNQELEAFAYVASHDLQEPLRKIQAFGDRLSRGYGEVLEGKGKDYLERMQSAATRMRALIEDLLAYARVTSKARPFEPVNLDHIAGEVVQDLSVRLDRSGGTVQIEDLPTIEADGAQMHQLLQNLIGNALKFQRAGVPPAVTISATRRNAGTVELSISDNGIGFEMEHSARLFQPFERLHGRTAYEGTGMGLAICRKIVERHGGTIAFDSVPGEGTTFILNLPFEQPSLGTQGWPSSESPS